MRGSLGSLGIVFALSILLVGPVEAQFPVNIVAGPTFANLSGDDAEGFDSKTGFFVGAGTAIPLNETFFIEPYVAYVQKGADDAGAELSLDYIEIPVFLSANIPISESVALFIGAGPQVGFNINCDDDGFDCSDEDDLNKTDFGIVTSAGLGFPLSDTVFIGVGGGADFGLTDVFDSGDAGNRAYYVSASVGMLLGG